MTETLKTFVGARLAVDKDRKETSDVAAEDDALVSLLAGAGISDPNGRILSQLVLKEEAPIPHLDHHLLMETMCRLRLTCSKGKMLSNHMHKLKHQFLLKVSMQPMLIMAYPLMATELS